MRDNGQGASAEGAARLFETFVSTMGVQGVGAGLSICRTIIERRGGKIWLDPNSVSRATVRVIVPSHGRAEAA